MRQSQVYTYWTSSRFRRNIGKLRHLYKSSYFKLQSRIRGFQDYFHFPFDITKPMPSSSQEELFDLVNFLNSKGVEYLLAEGTLLGLVRDGKLISHDTDLDFYLTDTKSIEDIHVYLSAKGYKVGRRLKRNQLLFQITYFNSEDLLIDFLIWKRTFDGDFFWVGPEIKGKRVQSSSFFDYPTYITWKGLSIRTFGKYESWLELVYGDSWKIPEEQKTDWTKTIGDLKKSR